MNVKKISTLLSLEEASLRMLAAVAPVSATELIPLENLLNRILAEDILSPLDSPPTDNSAMDGYAFLTAGNEGGSRLKIIGEALAGKPFDAPLVPGQTVRIMTGAVVPAGTDTVMMQENVSRDDDQIILSTRPVKGANIRRAGEDIRLNEKLFDAGHRLGTVDLGLLATLGLAGVRVFEPLKVALFASGDELRPPGHILRPGEIYDSNRYFLHAMLDRLGCAVVDLGVVPDNIDRQREAYLDAAEQSDAIITCGGASVGKADYAQQLLQELGEIGFWKVAIKPGKPFMFGGLCGSIYFGLPGNPVSALVTFHQLVLPVLQKMQGAQAEQPLVLRGATTCEIRPNRSRLEFLRGVYRPDAKGDFIVTPDPQQSSGALGPMSRCNCFIRVQAGNNLLGEGDIVDILPFDNWLR